MSYLKEHPTVKKIIVYSSIIGGLMGIYKGVVFFGQEYEHHIDRHVERKLSVNNKMVQALADSLSNKVSGHIDFLTKRGDIGFNIIMAETEPFESHGYTFWKTNENTDGDFHVWYKAIEEYGVIMYEAVYNPTERAYGYLDRFNKYHLLK